MFLAILIIFFFVFFYYLYDNYRYWKKRGVPGPTPSFFFGNIRKSLLLKKSLVFIYNDIYKDYPNEPYVGVFRAFSPTLIIRDRELVKDIFIRNFQYFANNDLITDHHKDPLFGRNPFVLRGAMWKKTRTEAIRCFTKNKVKSWFPFLDENATELVKFIEKSNQPFEARDLCAKFTVSNVARCALGLDAEAFKVKGDSELERMSKSLLLPTEIFLNHTFPVLRDFIKLKIQPKQVEAKLLNIVGDNIKYRLNKKIDRNDLLQTILEIKQKDVNNKNFEIEVAAHVAGFFTDGYETSTIAMSFLLYNIASNKDVQQKLRQEVKQKIQEFGELNFESVQEMKYLEAALYESLRKFPVLPILKKECSKAITINNLVLEPGISIIIPALVLQNDPKHWGEPEKFKPERFLKENMNKEDVRGIYFGFGDGPRVCLGQRFGSMQIRAGVAHLIRNYEISVHPKTQQPLIFDPVDFLLTVIGGIWLDFKKFPLDN